MFKRSGMSYQTEQEAFWAGEFGDQYLQRNDGDILLASNLAYFSRALKSAGKIQSVIEFGANIGMNQKALKLLHPELERFAIEINPNACKKLASHLGEENVFEGSIYDYPVERQFELSMIRGVMIHLEPAMLPKVYEKLYQSSSKYILVIEYYNPKPVEIDYRGHSGKLFKRDFAGEMLDQYPDLRLVDYGFGYHRDPSLHCKVDDSTWFLMEKMTSVGE